MKHDLLPLVLRHLLNDASTIVNLIHEYERCEAREQWGALRRDTQQKAQDDIQRRAQALCDRLGMMPSERWALQEQIQELQKEIQRLTAANVALAQGKGA